MSEETDVFEKLNSDVSDIFKLSLKIADEIDTQATNELQGVNRLKYFFMTRIIRRPVLSIPIMGAWINIRWKDVKKFRNDRS